MQAHPTPITQRRQQRLRTLNRGALLLALGWLLILGVRINPDAPELNDFKNYWQAAVDVLETGDPYTTTPDWNDPTVRQQYLTGTLDVWFYPNLPIFAVLIQPLGLLSQPVAQRIWFGLNVVMVLSFIALAIQGSGSRLAQRYWGLVLLLTLTAPPIFACLLLGQVGILLALLMVASFLLVERHPPFSGLLLALAGLIKLYPGLLGLYHLWTHSRRVVIWTIASGLGLLLLSLLAYGPAPYLSYIDKLLLSGFYPYAGDFNISLVGYWDRLLVPGNYTFRPLADLPLLARGLTLLSALAVLGLTLWVGRRPPGPTGRLLRYSLWLCAMLLLSPVNGYYNLGLLLFPLLAILRWLEQQPSPLVRTWLLAGTILCYVPPYWDNSHPALYRAVHTGWGLFITTPALYGLLIYFGLLVWLNRRSDEPPAFTLPGNRPPAN